MLTNVSIIEGKSSCAGRNGSSYGRAIFIGVLLALATLARAQWTQVTPGVEYRKFTLSDPNNVFVTRMDRATTSLMIDTLLSGDTIREGREKVSSMAARAEDTIGYWGQEWGKYRYDVVVAVNADFFNMTTGVPIGGQVLGGWYAKRHSNSTGTSGFAYSLNRGTFIGGCVTHTAGKNKVAYPAKVREQYITDVDRARSTNELILYTPFYDTSTQTDASGSEVLVQMSKPALIQSSPAYTTGTVKAIYQNAGNTPIPFDHVVLSATGTAASTLLANVSVGAEVRISQEIAHYGPDCSTPSNYDWTKAYASTGGGDVFLKGGAPYDITDTALHPRTAYAYNATWIYFVVVDGRTDISIGMNMSQLAKFCINYLAATDGVNLDGGGSTTMWVNGSIRNHPSDSTERTVANGVAMIRLVDNSRHSSAFRAGGSVATRVASSMRRGPGTNWGVQKSLTASATGKILVHPLNGIYAKGQYWWNCQFGADQGWVSQNELSGVSGMAPWTLY